MSSVSSFMTTHIDKIDKTAVRAIQKGNFSVLEEIYAAFYTPIFGFLFLKSANREVAQDLASEIFLRFFEYVLRGNEIGHVRGFLYRSARNALAMHFRSFGKEMTIDTEELSEIGGGIDEKDVIEERLDIQITLEAIHQSLRELKSEWREVIFFRFVEGYTYAEIAEIRNTSEGAVRVIVSRAVKELKKFLKLE